jgi:hypothetical protein
MGCRVQTLAIIRFTFPLTKGNVKRTKQEPTLPHC